MGHLIAGVKGFVGKETARLFPDAEGYDLGMEVPDKRFNYAHICVPTPGNADGSCDISAIEDVIGKVKADLFICKSTIPPGTTDRLTDKWGVNMVMMPEYVASSSIYPAPLGDITKRDFLIFGGRKENTKKARRLYEKVYPPIVRVMETDAITAELIKLFENTAIANKVTLCNEFFYICRAFGVDYDTVREGVFELDPRFSGWWTYCAGNGWGGHCLPKDVDSLIISCIEKGYHPSFIRSIVENNERHKNG